jgi:hypothetical protein
MSGVRVPCLAGEGGLHDRPDVGQRMRFIVGDACSGGRRSWRARSGIWMADAWIRPAEYELQLARAATSPSTSPGVGVNRPGFSGGSSPESGDYLIQDANRCGFHVSRREFESCPIGCSSADTALFMGCPRPTLPADVELQGSASQRDPTQVRIHVVRGPVPGDQVTPCSPMKR